MHLVHESKVGRYRYTFCWKTLTAAASGRHSDDAYRIGPEEVDLPPRRGLLHGLGAPFAIVHRRPLAIVGVGGRPASHRRRLIGWLFGRHVDTCDHKIKLITLTVSQLQPQQRTDKDPLMSHKNCSCPATRHEPSSVEKRPQRSL